MPFSTKFTTAVAVDTWDSHFRWRVGDELRDRTIDASWRRVAQAVVGPEGGQGEQWAQRFVEAFCSWRILPDARLLKWGGTGSVGKLDNPRATLNLSAYIVRPQASRPYFDHRTFGDMAELAVRFLDDSWMTYSAQTSTPSLSVGLMGLGDALGSLGYPYVSEQACTFATQVGSTLSSACRAASSTLMRERGASCINGDAHDIRSNSSGTPLGRGLRHMRTTAIHPHPLLAFLANQTSDALDPQTGSSCDMASRWLLAPPADPVETGQLLLQQLKLRGTLQPWIDAPIDYPLVYSGEQPSPEVIAACMRSASGLGLPKPKFRRSEQPIASLG